MNYEVNSNYKVVPISDYELEFKHGLYSSEGFTIEDKDREANLRELLDRIKSFERPEENQEQFEAFKNRLMDEGYLRKTVQRRVERLHIDSLEDLDFSADHFVVYTDNSSLLKKVNSKMYKEDQSWTAVWDGPRKVFVASFHPDETGCFNCLKERIDSNEDYTEYETDSMSGISKHFMETEKRKFERHETSETSGTLYSVDKEAYVSSREKILRLPRCKVCGSKNPSQTFIQTEDIE